MIAQILAWSMSLFGGIAYILYGNKSKYAPMIGLFHQGIVLWYAVASEYWGLVPGVCFYVVVHIRNLWKWHKETWRIAINEA